jgi:hypothetical protein
MIIIHFCEFIQMKLVYYIISCDNGLMLILSIFLYILKKMKIKKNIIYIIEYENTIYVKQYYWIYTYI